MKPRGLTEKQKRFVDFYIETGNATEAARRAGYKKPNPEGSRLLVNVSIRNAIAGRMKEIESQRVASAAEVMQFLTSVMRGEAKEESNEEPQPVAQRDRLKAAELLMRRFGMGRSAMDEEEQRLRIEKLKAEIEGTAVIEDDGFVEALKRSGKDVWDEGSKNHEADHTV